MSWNKAGIEGAVLHCHHQRTDQSQQEHSAYDTKPKSSVQCGFLCSIDVQEDRESLDVLDNVQKAAYTSGSGRRLYCRCCLKCVVFCWIFKTEAETVISASFHSSSQN